MGAPKWPPYPPAARSAPARPWRSSRPGERMSEKIADSVLELIGGTPLVRLRRLPEASGARVLAKIEARNPGASVKDRIAAAMIDDAERRGVLKPGATIVE